ncbi:MAG TPA: hypothetical protein VF777_09140 [Phycisphaerales bacterium]
MRSNHKALSLLALVAAAGVTVLATDTLAGRLPVPPPNPPICPDVYAPVICANGVVYPNYCYAIASGQSNCVPYGDSPI